MTGVPSRATPDDAADVAQDHLLPEAEVWLVADPLPCAVLALGDGWIDRAPDLRYVWSPGS